MEAKINIEPFCLYLVQQNIFNTFLASDDFCHLLITFANSLDPDQDRCFKLFDTLIVFLKEFFFKSQQTTKKKSREKLTSMQRVSYTIL